MKAIRQVSSTSDPPDKKTTKSIAAITAAAFIISGVIQYGKNFLVIWRSSEAVICSGYDLPDDLSRLA
jgi:hypothetical protein